MKKRRPDDSVFDEPHMRGGGFASDPSERRAAANLEREHRRPPSDDERVEHTVWDEPALSDELAGPKPQGGLDYRQWLEHRRRETVAGKSWLVTLVVALAAGPWAILGAMIGERSAGLAVVALVIVGPVVEELMKSAAPLWVIEKRPFYFRSPFQIAICVIASGAVFAAIENLLYLRVYIPDPSPMLTQWRWTVCVALHIGCAFIVGMGLMRIWRDTWERMARPRLQLGFPYLVTGIALHAAYNAFALVLHFTDFHF